MDKNKAKILQMLREPWENAGPSLGGWGVNNAYFNKNSNLADDASRPMALNLETGKQTAMKKGGKVKKAKPKCMSRGGGCEVRGKTKGRFV
jgi:hypothetical protein